jgi:hypothetical protein
MANHAKQLGIFTRTRFFAFIAGAFLISSHAYATGRSGCTCSDGRSLAPGDVSYSRNSDRDVINRVEQEGNAAQATCAGIWIAGTEIHVRGTPYDFYLQRMALRERRIDGCGDLTERFVKRNKAYVFVFDSDSTSIREMRSVDSSSQGMHPPAGDSKSESNTNLWNAISVEEPSATVRAQESFLKIDSSREFNRTAWVFSRKDTRGHYVAIEKDSAQNEILVPLKKTRMVRAGQLGQIEAANSGHAIVRFYLGSRIARFAKVKHAIQRWYDNIGGPYQETKDDLYTPLRAYIVEVALDDLIEVNDYLDQIKADETRPVGL